MTDTLDLFIEPTDVWLFRDGKPFDAGSDHRARSLFPPPPSVLQGALRSAYLAQQQISFTDYVHGTSPAEVYAAIGPTAHADYGTLSIRGPFVAGPDIDGKLQRYYPLPADLVWSEEHCTWQRLHPVNTANQQMQVSWSADDPTQPPAWLFSTDPSAEHLAGRWLAESALVQYLKNGVPPARQAVLTEDALFEREARVGLKLEGKLRAAEETLLYEVEFVRPRPGVGLMATVEGLGNAAWREHGVLQLGGEQRLGYYQRLKSEAAPAAVGNLTGDFCLYLATPTYFDGGWQPQGGDWSGYFTGAVPTLVAAAVGKPLTLGGIDLAASSRRRHGGGITHKPARRLVPAGSMYYFHSEGAVQLKNPNSLCNGPDWQIGFGQVLAGQWERGDADV